MSKLAAMPFFPAEFFADTAHMTPDAAKAYLFLLGHAWLRGAKLPNHDPELARLARVSTSGWKRMREQVMALWTLDEDGVYRQKRLSKEYQFVLTKAEQNRENGKLGGRPSSVNKAELVVREKNQHHQNAEQQLDAKSLTTRGPTEANGCHLETETNPPTPTPTKVSKKKPIYGLEDAFSEFWEVYPKREGSNPRKPAFDKFAALAKQGTEPDAITAGARAYAYQCQATGKVGTTYVAQAITWLNQQRWLDDYALPNGKPRKENISEYLRILAE